MFEVVNYDYDILAEGDAKTIIQYFKDKYIKFDTNFVKNKLKLLTKIDDRTYFIYSGEAYRIRRIK